MLNNYTCLLYTSCRQYMFDACLRSLSFIMHFLLCIQTSNGKRDVIDFLRKLTSGACYNMTNDPYDHVDITAPTHYTLSDIIQ